jgi:hypothetical protein
VSVERAEYKMDPDENPQEKHPPENIVLFQLAIAESALRRIAGVEWPINLHGESPQKIAREALTTT